MRKNVELTEKLVALLLMPEGWRGAPGCSLKDLEGIQRTSGFGDHRELTGLRAVCPCTKMTKEDAGKNIKPSITDSLVALDPIGTGSPVQGC